MVGASVGPPATAQPVFERVISPFTVRDSSGAELAQPFFGGFNSPQPQLVDIDGDDDLDLFVQDRRGDIAYFENVGSPASPDFQWRTDRFHDIAADGWFYFVDADSDGDPDLLAPAFFDRIRYLENDGDAQTPNFVERTAAVLDTAGAVVFTDPPMIPAVSDIDCDSAFDLFLGQQSGTIVHYELHALQDGVPVMRLESERFQNIEVLPPGSGKSVSRTRPLHGASAQAFFDRDGDGAVDLLYGDFFEGSLIYFENTGDCLANNLVRVSDTLLYDADVPFLTSGYNVPSAADIDGDGDSDLLVGVRSVAASDLVANLYDFRNDGDGAFALAASRVISGIDVGSQSAPALADVDRNGTTDLVVGSSIGLDNQNGTLTLAANDGIPGAPVFRLVDTLLVGSSLGFNLTPAFADIDDDADDDLFVGGFDGTITFFENQEGIFVEITTAFADVDVGSNSAPAFGDMDGDGDLDLVVGEFSGTINFVENVGTRASPSFGPAVENYASIDIGDYSRPFIADLDEDGRSDLLIGSRGAGLRLYRGTAVPASFDDAGLVVPDIIPFATPTLWDADDDGDQDLVLGTEGGGLVFFENTAIGSTVETPGVVADPAYITVYPNPFFGELTVEIAWQRPLPADLQIVDAAGRLVASIPIPASSSSKSVVSMSSAVPNLASGVYFIRLMTEDGVAGITNAVHAKR